ncbi:EscU/YscU/HrcU family type III secretion system export apparatus switch protein [Cellulomonas fimi]|uniref:Type III secretion exporter n=1 Tax=Cellulomonas fimi (strain ATCC 484 / DSM 20113 / JCM 1341 / CCUG 24087 / LMG 16345 / NBRC 15513 / NCIMB 8980 / NCTC 7547 / NRS-133) TaxID=590998 RepID=F4GZB2_CELFA|nr:EscU/YscU/HrcU family type III secretion system export apparatus switch protein [Cellulomonas fimi]AEE44833.1 type III secretion exporter [Cellulomonas fimi ATCC 484]NNH08352.1 EscU/YscU/HrcU family type III secretion system export apparatus switch protein [Cellulomonas fimi]VEH27424.1 Flagellar biosynthetic protein flhB [Cellulomonas fimi]
MSEGGDRTEKATPQRMREIRRKGGLGRSQDLSAWVGLGAAAAVLPLVVDRARAAALDQMAAFRDVAADPDGTDVVQVLGDGLGTILTTLLPLFAVGVVAAVAVSAAQGGVHLHRLRLHADHLKPKGVASRLVGGQAWWQGIKTLLKTAAVALVLLAAVQAIAPALLASGRLPLSHLIGIATDGTATLLRTGIAAGVLLAVADVVVVWRRNRKQTRMTLREVKEEHKRTEGDPMLKGAIRSKQLAMSRNRMMAEVANADVVLVNPTHVAVALRYEPGTGAPRVVAKGAGAVAAKIRSAASDARVPMVEDVPLARALHAACELGQEIPAHLFTAVARVLAFVMALRRRGAASGQHRVPGGSTLPPDDTTDHRATARAAVRDAARAGRRPAAAEPRTAQETSR